MLHDFNKETKISRSQEIFAGIPENTGEFGFYSQENCGKTPGNPRLQDAEPTKKRRARVVLRDSSLRIRAEKRSGSDSCERIFGKDCAFPGDCVEKLRVCTL